jgi:hypothetical protein
MLPGGIRLILMDARVSGQIRTDARVSGQILVASIGE